jgi:hypothetical protein
MDEDEVNPDNAVAEGHEQPAAVIFQLLAYPEIVVDFPKCRSSTNEGCPAKLWDLGTRRKF